MTVDHANPSIFSLSDYLGLEPQEGQVLRLGHAAVAASTVEPAARPHHRAIGDLIRQAAQNTHEQSCTPDDVAAFGQSLTAGDARWRQLLYDWTVTMHPARRVLLALELSTGNPILGEAALAGGVAQRRLDAVLDILDVPFSCTDAQGVFGQVANDLAWTATPTGGKAAVYGAGGVTSLVSGYLGVGGKPGSWVNQHGMDYFVDRSRKRPATDMLARLALACDLAIIDQPGGRKEVRTLVLRLINMANRLSAEIGRDPENRSESMGRLRPIRGAIEMLTTTLGESIASVGNIAVPDLSGQRLSDAVETLEALGLNVLYEDQGKADGTRRTVMTKRNWRVVNQQVFPAASSNDVPTVRLIVLNQSD